MSFLQLFLHLIFFLCLSILIFFLPGFWIVKQGKDKLENQEILALSFSLSLTIFLLVTISFGLMNLRMLTLPAILVIGSFTIFKYRMEILASWKIFLEDKFLLVLIILGILTLGFINFPNGLKGANGLQFWSSQGYDGVWHVALMEEIKKNFPPQNPLFAGEGLVNYHYFGDIIMGEFFRIFPLFSSWDLHFRFFPILFSFMIMISVYALLTRWQQNKIAGYLGIFFTVFTGSFGYILTFLRNGNLFGGETAFWASQLNTIISNPPHAISISLISSFFLGLYFFEKAQKKYWLVILILLGGFVSGFKVSAGVSLLGGLWIAILIYFIFGKRSLLNLVLLTTLGLLNFLTFSSITKSGSSLLIFEPWWFIRTLIVEKLGWIDLELKRQTYLAEHNFKRVLQIELMGFFIYLIGNAGTRIIGFLFIGKKLLRIKDFTRNYFELSIFMMSIVAFMIPLLFLQKGVPANIIQFIQYFLLIFGFYSAIATFKIFNLLQNRLLRIVFIVLIILLSIPTVIGNFKEFYWERAATTILSTQEFEALSFLRNHSAEDATVLTIPFNKYLKTRFNNSPLPIFAWYPTPYVSAVSSRRTYLSSEEMLDQTGYPYRERLKKEEKFFSQEDMVWSKGFLKEANISFIYITKTGIEKPLKTANTRLIYENSEVQIYKVGI